MGLWMAPGDGECYLRPDANDKTKDIPLINVGVLIIPDSSIPAEAFGAATLQNAVDIVRGNNSNEATRAGWFGHWTFSHRDPKVLRHMPDCTNAPASWRNMKLDSPCRSCLRATVNRVNSCCAQRAS